MTEEQCAEAYDILANLLRRLNLEWVMDQVDADVRVGKLVEKPIREISVRHTERSVAFELVELL